MYKRISRIAELRGKPWLLLDELVTNFVVNFKECQEKFILIKL